MSTKELNRMSTKISQIDSIKVFNNMLENINKSVERNSIKQNNLSTEIVNNLNFINILDQRIKKVDVLEKEMQGDTLDSQNKKMNNKSDLVIKLKSKSITNL
jgi:hypothetical protein